MNEGRKRSDSETSFEGLVSFDSVPPAGEVVNDVHNARTAIAALPDSFLDDLRKKPKSDVLERVQQQLDVDDDRDTQDFGVRAGPAAVTYDALPEPASPAPMPARAPLPTDAMTTIPTSDVVPPLPTTDTGKQRKVSELNAAVSAALAAAGPPAFPTPTPMPSPMAMSAPMAVAVPMPMSSPPMSAAAASLPLAEELPSSPPAWHQHVVLGIAIALGAGTAALLMWTLLDVLRLF